MLERMDWGTYIDEGTFIRFGAVGLDYPEPCLKNAFHLQNFLLDLVWVICTLIADSFLCTCCLRMSEANFYELVIAGAKEVYDDDDMFILMAPQNAVGNCIIDVRHPISGLEVYHKLLVEFQCCDFQKLVGCTKNEGCGCAHPRLLFLMYSIPVLFSLTMHFSDEGRSASEVTIVGLNLYYLLITRAKLVP